MLAMQEFLIGQKVRVVQSDAKPWTADWRDTYIVTGARLEYQRGDPGVNYSIASQDEIDHKLGSTDDIFAADLAHA